MKMNEIKTNGNFWTIKVLGFLAFMSVSLFSFGQQSTDDVVYLKNGSVIRGSIVELVPDGNITIEIMGGSTLVYPMAEVEKITKEKSRYEMPIQKAHYIKHRGFFNSSEIGLGFGSQNYYYGGITSNVSMQTINGFQYSRHLQAGLGIGIDYYTNQPLLYNPVFIRISGDIINNPVTPFYYVDGGYTFVWEEDNNDATTYEGGIMFNPGIGVKFYSRTKASYTIGFGYKSQKSTYTYNNPWDNSVFVEKRTFNRLTLKLGIGF